MKYIFVLVIGLLAQNAFAGINDKNFGSVIVDEVTSIYDGDTFRVNISSWPDVIGQRIPIRVNGVDTPEIRGECKQEKVLARKAKKITVDFLRSGQKVELRNMKRGKKYFRLSADVYVDGKSLAEKLISVGLAYEYYGGKKKAWCNN